MTKVFIGGSRGVSRLGTPVRMRLDHIMLKRFPILVGDANGTDRAVQRYLFSKSCKNVEVFCSGAACRNNIGNWPTRHVETNRSDRGFRFYTAKDRAMSREAGFGLMIWDGKSAGTLLNVLRLLRQDKEVVIYCTSERQFAELRSWDQWCSFIAAYGSELRSEIEYKVRIEDRGESTREQASFLPMASE